MSKRIMSNFPMAVIAISLGLIGLVAIGVEAGDWHNAPLICSDCHVMHASLNAGGTTYNAGAGYANLLKSNNTNTLCLACHSQVGPNAITRPLVADYTGADTNCGGLFNFGRMAGATVYAQVSGGGDFIDSRSHNLYSSAVAQPQEPGSAAGAYDDGVNFMTCASCHEPHGNANYRNLVGDPNPNNAGITSCTITATYYANNWHDTSVWQDSGIMTVTDMSLFCQDCHQKFGPSAVSALGMITAGNAYDAQGLVDNAPGANTHHPVDQMMTVATLANYNAVAGTAGDTYPLLNSSGARDAVGCVTCHRAHGSKFNDSLRFSSDSAALSGGPEGCQACHAK